MLAVILGAGEGTRMRPLTFNRPKVMLPVLGRPMIERIVSACVEAGILRVIIVTGYKGEAIRSHFDKVELGARIEYATQRQQRGTADALNQVRDLVDERFLALNGDSVVSPSTLKLLANAACDHTVLIAAKRVKEPSNYGVLEVIDNAVVRITEKPDHAVSDLANLGIYTFEPTIFEWISKTQKSARGEYEITDTIQLLIDDGRQVGFTKVEAQWIDVGRPWDLLSANELLLQTVQSANEGTIEPLATITGPVRIGRGSVIKNGAYITGPVIIGEECEIGPNCLLRPGVCIGDGVKIGNAVEVKNSIIMDGSKIGHLSYVGDSVIGTRCNFGAGTIVANLRFDEKPVKLGGVETGRRKLGVIMGDDVRTGINSAINVGTSIGPGSTLGVGAVATGVYPPGSRIESRFEARR
ncbi:MAG TPA: bifunctional sugar-1-phosphate nucleotidylyltransferase/acetyltransferase [Candidatus Bathyarchaeia archaeon]|nr:bifunctional sugar-1-phosphate nucleotidylyltransferase/acetyltransferase [Candidatus Bathyarchaeia archaeon]